MANKANGLLEPAQAIGCDLPHTGFDYTARDVILYALGVGVSTNQPDHLKHLFEEHDKFCVLPTYGLTAPFGCMQGITRVPGLEAMDLTKFLHGEHYLEMKRPLSTSGKLTNRATVVDILDKGSGMMLIVNANSYDENNELVIYNQFVFFIVGAGGYGGHKTSSHLKQIIKPPSREPDASAQEKTTIDQAALYRLSGDYNPLHIDPDYAAKGGFPTPILHGLCTVGFACRHVLKQYADNDVTKFKAVKVRFTKPVLPGQTIQTDMWKEGSRVHFQSKVIDNDTVCLSGAYLDLAE